MALLSTVGAEGIIGQMVEAQPELIQGFPDVPQVFAMPGEVQMRKWQQPLVLSSESVATGCVSVNETSDLVSVFFGSHVGFTGTHYTWHAYPALAVRKEP